MIEGVLSRMYLATCSMTARIDPEVDDQLTKWINVTRDSFFKMYLLFVLRMEAEKNL